MRLFVPSLLLLWGLQSCRAIVLYSNEWLLETDEDPVEISKHHGFVFFGEVIPGFYVLKRPEIRSHSARPAQKITQKIQRDVRVKSCEQQVWKKRSTKATVIVSDPKWPTMWYLNPKPRYNLQDMKVLQAWNMGVSGKSIGLAIVDDGIEYTNPDLLPNYDNKTSFDFSGNSKNPWPDSGNSHGTHSAGVAAAAKNNICGIGTAYNAKLAGLKIFGSGMTLTSREGRALSYKSGTKPKDVHETISIYSNSWGAEEKTTYDGPDAMVQKTLKTGVYCGREGRGSIFVFAAGNGYLEDNCNCDGYANSVYTVAITSVNFQKRPSDFAEICTAALAATYSGGASGLQLTTTDISNGCIETFTGTSASTPLAAGIIALALEANGNLTWRDVQHLIVETAKSDKLVAGDVHTNGAGKKVSKMFGFGLVDAEAMVSRAKTWKFVPPQKICIENTQTVGKRFTDSTSSTLTTNLCNDEIQYLEHVQVTINYEATPRGAVQFVLVSAQNTASAILTKRPQDKVGTGSSWEWTFMTVHNWGENPKGNWTLKFTIDAGEGSGTLHWWKITFYGTKDDPKLGTADDQPALGSSNKLCPKEMHTTSTYSTTEINKGNNTGKWTNNRPNVTQPTKKGKGKSSSGLSTGGIIGASLGGAVAGSVAVGTAAGMLYKIKKRNKNQPHPSKETEPGRTKNNSHPAEQNMII